MKPLPRSYRSVRAGFSLAELMVVIVIIGLLATIVVPNVWRKFFVAQDVKARADISAIAAAITEFAINNQGRPPDSLEVLVTPDENNQRYLDRSSVPKDPWGNEYQYEPPRSGQDFRVYTYGADGAPGGEGKDGDIDNEMVKEGTK